MMIPCSHGTIPILNAIVSWISRESSCENCRRSVHDSLKKTRGNTRNTISKMNDHRKPTISELGFASAATS